VSLRSRIDAEIVNVHFREGDEVKAGDVLFTLDSRAIEAQLRQVQATLERDRSQLDNARRDLARKTELSQQGYATAASLDQAKAAFGAASGTIKASEAAVQNLRVQLSYAVIRAPIGGRTGSVTQTKGNMVKANDPQPLVVINRVKPVKATFAVPQANFDDVSRSLARGRVEVVAQIQGEAPSQPGTVTFVDNQIDTATGTFQVKASFPNDAGALWPGMMVNIVIRLGVERGVPTVPLTAVVTGQQGPFVFVIKPDETVELRQITVARESGDRVVVAKGLAPGERVVVDGQLRLANGSKVAVRAGAPPQVAADPARPSR
jgi:multidrug efflux system membrane fusion protein